MRLAALLLALAVPSTAAERFEVSYTADAAAQALAIAPVTTSADGGLTGRVRLYFAFANDTLPAESDSDDQDSVQVFGVDAEDLLAGDVVTVSDTTLGYPRPTLAELEPGTYFVQAELVLYDRYARAELPEVWLPQSCVSSTGEGTPEGTLRSAVVQVDLKAGGGPVQLSLDRVVPSVDSPGCAGLGDAVDSDWIKTVRVQSDLLTEFWGRPITLEACVLLPGGFDEHPNATFPLVIAHGHFSPVWNAGGSFRETDPECDPDTDGYDCVSEQYAYYLYQNWTSLAEDAGNPFSGARMMVATINHPVPFFDDSYAVNSENVGPYGDAINFELVPEIERRYRGVGAGWARGVFGGSTGGWESIATQVLYPDEYNSAFAACPDPIAFSAYTSIDIYADTNAFYYNSDFKRTEKPGQRDAYSGTTWPGYGSPYGRTAATVKEMNHHELVLGAKSRSCGQFDIWEAVFSPVCTDGFPCRLFDKFDGTVNTSVAAFWRENYDLQAIMEANWATLGPKLQGKLHLFAGADDTWFLNNAVMTMQDFLRTTSDPASDAEVVLGEHEGRGFAHCFRGYQYDEDGNKLPNSITRLLYTQAFLPVMAEHFSATAPEGADVTSWRY